MVPTFLVTSMSMPAFLIPPEKLAGRLGISVTLFLTVAAYKLIVAGSLPQVPKQTLLDKYLFGCTLFLCFSGVLNAVACVMSWRGSPRRATQICANSHARRTHTTCALERFGFRRAPRSARAQPTPAHPVLEDWTRGLLRGCWYGGRPPRETWPPTPLPGNLYT